MFYAVHEKTVSVFDPDALTVPGVPERREIRNDFPIESCDFFGGKLYYIGKGNGYHRNIYEFDVSSGVTHNIRTVDCTVSMICVNGQEGKIYAAAPSSYGSDGSGFDGSTDVLVSFSFNTESKEKYTDLKFAYGDFITSGNTGVCIGNGIIGGDGDSFVFHIGSEAETPVFCDENMRKR